jgi:hypothetical protein
MSIHTVHLVDHRVNKERMDGVQQQLGNIQPLPDIGPYLSLPATQRNLDTNAAFQLRVRTYSMFDHNTIRSVKILRLCFA